MINAEGDARASAPILLKHSQHSLATAQSHADDPTHDYYVTDCLESVHEEEEDMGYAGVAGTSLNSRSTSKGATCAERAPPRDPRASSFTLDMGDFVGGALGGGDPVDVGPGGAQVCHSAASGLDGQLPSMEGHP